MDRDGAGVAAGSAPRRKKLLLMAAGGVVAASTLAAGLWFSGILSRSHQLQVTRAETDLQPIFVETPEMVTNLDAGAHRLSFVKIQCKIEVAHRRDASALTAAMPRIVDMIQSYLRETRPEELRSGTGTYRLREALLLRASLAASSAEIKSVLFQELLVQ